MPRIIRKDPPCAIAAMVLVLTLAALPVVAFWPV